LVDLIYLPIHGNRIKGDKFTPSEAMKKAARNTGLAETRLGKAAKMVKDKIAPASASGVKGIVKGAAPYMAPTAGRVVGSMAGETGADIGQAAGLVGMAKALKVPTKAKSFSKFLARKIPSIMGKAGAIALADSPAPGPGDLLALGFTAWEIIDLYNEWTAQD
jgi:hypothetical protein